MPFNLLVKSRWPDATLSIFDTNALLTDIFHNPSQYLDPPAKATGVYHLCDSVNTSSCVVSPDAPSSFLWYDELHPTEKARKYDSTNRASFGGAKYLYKADKCIGIFHRYIHSTGIYQCR